MAMADNIEMIEYGQRYYKREIIPFYQHRLILRMDVLETATSYMWRLYLDCGHTLDETLLKSQTRTSPVGAYRNCPQCKAKSESYVQS